MNHKVKFAVSILLLFLFAHTTYTTVAEDNSVYVTVFSEENGFDICAQLSTSNTQNTVSADSADDNTYYLFLPTYAKDKPVRFDCGEHIRIEAADNTKRRYLINQEYSLEILYGSYIPTIYLTLENDLSYITSDKELTDSGQATFINADGSIAYSGNLEEIKGRGNNSWKLDKKPFQIKISDILALGGIPTGNEFSLVTSNEYSFLRNYISNEMAKAMNAFTLNCIHINLYINNEYQGIYELWNKLTPDALGITDLEAVNEGVIDSFPALQQLTTDSYLDDWTHAPTGKWWDYKEVSKDNTGGYILEADYSSRYLEEASGFTLDSGASIVVKSPKYISQTQYDYISEYVKTCEAVMYDSVGLDNYDTLSEYIDINSFITKYLVEEVSKNYDCSSSSQYFYKDANNVLYAGPVWDYSAAYCAGHTTDSINYDDPEGFCARDIPGTLNWWQLLYYNQEFHSDMTYVYSSTLYPYLDELTKTLLPQWEAALTDSAVMDALKWKRAASVEAARNAYHNDVTIISDFLEARKEFLYHEWN